MEIPIEEVRAKIIAHIADKYGMTVYGFSVSEWPAKLGIAGGNTLRCYLQGASTSFPTFKKLCAHFGLGTFTQRRVVTSHTVYELGKPTIPRQVVKKTPASKKPPAKSKAPLRRMPVK